MTAEPPGVDDARRELDRRHGARLNGRVDPNSRATTYFFEYGTTTSYGSKTSSSSAGSGTNATSVSKTVTGLKAGTTYHFRLVATSNAGTVQGADQAFTTPSPPDRRDRPRRHDRPDLGDASAASVNPNGRSTTWYVEYGTTHVLRLADLIDERRLRDAALTVYATPTNLKPGVTYHFRVVATNSVGTSRGADATFATTGAPGRGDGAGHVHDAVAHLGAQVNGTLNPHGHRDDVVVRVRPHPRVRLPDGRAPQAAAGTAPIRVSSLLQSLTPGTRWHYRLVARSAGGTSVGADASFATPPRPLDPTAGPSAARSSAPRAPTCSAAPTAATSSAASAATTRSSAAAATTSSTAARVRTSSTAASAATRSAAAAATTGSTSRDGRRDVVAGGPGNDLADLRPAARPPHLG